MHAIHVAEMASHYGLSRAPRVSNNRLFALRCLNLALVAHFHNQQEMLFLYKLFIHRMVDCMM